MMRRDLLRLRNAAVPLVEVCRRLEHADAAPIEPQMQPLFRDVTDHIRRVQEEIDSLREVLAFAFEASLMAGQAQQNDHHPQARRLGRDPRRADRRRRHLRHEFRRYAGAALAVRLFRRDRRGRIDLRRPSIGVSET